MGSSLHLSSGYGIHSFSLYTNLFGICLWTFLYGVFLKLYELPSDLFHIHTLFFILVGIFCANILNSDNRGESTYENEMKLKDDVESLSSKLCVLIATILFSTSLLMKYKTISSKVKQRFIAILTTSLILLLLISSSINIPKTALKVRQLRKIESVLLNNAIGLICVAFVYIIHYL